MPDWEEVSETFVNPYNFVSLGNIKPEKKEAGKGGLTGVISCALKTVTPLAIPDSAEKEVYDKEKEHYKYPFFKVGGRAVIPGSEIRGMIRSVFEAATNSCMSVVNTNILSARNPFPREAGLIKKENGQWKLYKADKYMLNTEKSSYRQNEQDLQQKGTRYNIDKDGEKWILTGSGTKIIYEAGLKVNFIPGGHYKGAPYMPKIVKNICNANNNSKEGYLLLWADMAKRKHHNSIFVKTSDIIPCENSKLEQAVQNFHEVCKIYENNDESYKKITYELEEDTFTPVWFETVKDRFGNNQVYLSPACISRSVFNNSLEDLLGAHKKCESRENLCPACLLFGMVGEKKNKSLGSSLRFSDAVITKHDGNVFLGYKTLKTLANPKTSAVEFYTKRPDKAVTWTYDYKTTDYNKNSPARELTDITIRGRKFYLHDLRARTDENIYVNNSVKKEDHNSTVELVKEDNLFNFDVYFDNITEDQLKNIIWVLTFGENETDDKKFTKCHKLGHGKPLGLGSVKIKIDSIKTREIKIMENDVIFEEKRENTDILLKDCKINAPAELLKIADTNLTKNLNVSYPLADDGKKKDNSTAAHQWFTRNRNSGKIPHPNGKTNPTGMKLSVNHTLPSILDENIKLPKLDKILTK